VPALRPVAVCLPGDQRCSLQVDSTGETAVIGGPGYGAADVPAVPIARLTQTPSSGAVALETERVLSASRGASFPAVASQIRAWRIYSG